IEHDDMLDPRQAFLAACCATRGEQQQHRRPEMQSPECPHLVFPLFDYLFFERLPRAGPRSAYPSIRQHTPLASCRPPFNCRSSAIELEGAAQKVTPKNGDTFAVIRSASGGWALKIE